MASFLGYHIIGNGQCANGFEILSCPDALESGGWYISLTSTIRIQSKDGSMGEWEATCPPTF
eukprot:scaffold7915_cov152-Skeletonema_menzelii.AAC.8